MDPRKLNVLVESTQHPALAPVAAPQGDLPEAWGVLYGNANPDATRKLCSNCCLYVAGGTCAIHAPEVEVAPVAVCGYHVFGRPRAQRFDEQALDYVQPEQSGLVQAPAGGTSCDRCSFYEAQTARRGLCYGVVTPEGLPAPVEGLGCCARWTTRR